MGGREPVFVPVKDVAVTETKAGMQPWVAAPVQKGVVNLYLKMYRLRDELQSDLEYWQQKISSGQAGGKELLKYMAGLKGDVADIRKRAESLGIGQKPVTAVTVTVGQKLELAEASLAQQITLLR